MYDELYLIEILHQTTTLFCILFLICRCILSKFYIKPQRWAVFIYTVHSCILSKFYIKPQRRGWLTLWIWRCILSKFYIKPQLIVMLILLLSVVSYRNSTSNHNGCGGPPAWPRVVSYRNSTSNHNLFRHRMKSPSVVSYRNSTSNHNEQICWSYSYLLYLIEILHQTTTSGLILIDKVLLTGCLPL